MDDHEPQGCLVEGCAPMVSLVVLLALAVLALLVRVLA